MATRYKIYREGGTDVAVADGGTGASTAAGAFNNIKQAATDTATGVVEKSTSAENVTGTATDKFPDVAGVKEMIDTHAGGGGGASAFARAYRTTTQSIDTSSATKIQFNAETYDSENLFDSTTDYDYTAPSAGKYLVNVQVDYEDSIAGEKERRIQLRKNGTPVVINKLIMKGSTTDSLEGAMTISDILDLTTNDTLTVYAYHTAGVARGVSGGTDRTYISVCKLA